MKFPFIPKASYSSQELITVNCYLALYSKGAKLFPQNINLFLPFKKMETGILCRSCWLQILHPSSSGSLVLGSWMYNTMFSSKVRFPVMNPHSTENLMGTVRDEMTTRKTRPAMQTRKLDCAYVSLVSISHTEKLTNFMLCWLSECLQLSPS